MNQEIALLLALGTIVAWVVVVVAIWRGMKAHESIARSVLSLAKKMDEGINAHQSLAKAVRSMAEDKEPVLSMPPDKGSENQDFSPFSPPPQA